MEHYTKLADLFRYPSEDLTKDIEACQALLEEKHPEAAVELKKFTEYVRETPLYRKEEVFTKTFHIQAICYLDIGYMIFGEDYKRGEFLANMVREQAAAGNDCGDELADNLINVLTLLPKLENVDFKNELAVRILIPAIYEMLNEFRTSRIEKKVKIMKKKHNAVIQEGLKNGNIYQYPLRALVQVLEKDFEGISYEQEEPMPDYKTQAFINSCASSCGIPSNINSKKLKS